MQMKNEKGFSLVELLIVVTILGVLMALAIPGLRRAKQNAQMGAAVQAMRNFSTAQALYYKRYNIYGTLTDLGTEKIIDSVLSSGTKQEYDFLITVGATGKTYIGTGSPQKDIPRMDFFFVDESTIVRFQKRSPADVTSPQIPR